MSRTHEELAALARAVTAEMLAAWEAGILPCKIEVRYAPADFPLEREPDTIRVTITNMLTAAAQEPNP